MTTIASVFLCSNRAHASLCVPMRRAASLPATVRRPQGSPQGSPRGCFIVFASQDAPIGLDEKSAGLSGKAGEMEGIEELDKDTFYPALKAAGATLCVVDFYTEWCGPCKAIQPRIIEMARTNKGKAHFYKLNCSPANKELGKALAIKAVPTFHLYKDSVLVGTMSGANANRLEELVMENL